MRHKLTKNIHKEKFWSLRKVCLKNAFIAEEGKTVSDFAFVQIGFSVDHISKYCNLDYELEVSVISSVEEMNEFV